MSAPGYAIDAEGTPLSVCFDVQRLEWPLWSVVGHVAVAGARLDLLLAHRHWSRAKAQARAEGLSNAMMISAIDAGMSVRPLEPRS